MKNRRACGNVCSSCSYPRPPGVERCPECGVLFEGSRLGTTVVRPVVVGLIAVALSGSVIGGVWYRAGGWGGSLPNSALVALAKYADSELAFDEYRRRYTSGHSRLPAFLSPKPRESRFTALCLHVAMSPPTSPSMYVSAIESLVDDITAEVVVEAFGREIERGSSQDRAYLLGALFKLHSHSSQRWRDILTLERRDDFLQDPMPEIRLGAAHMLWAFGQDPRAMVVFGQSLAVQSERQSAVYWLGNPARLHAIDTRLGPGILTAIQESRDKLDGLRALRRLTYVDDGTLQRLVDVEWERSQELVLYHRILADAGPRAEPALAGLLTQLQNDDLEVRHSAMQALGGLGTIATAAIPELVRNFREGRFAVGDAVYGEIAAFEAIVSIAGRDALVFAVEALEESQSALVQGRALEVVALYAATLEQDVCHALQAVADRGATEDIREEAMALYGRLCR